ncbi:MAG: type II secretion system F family protein [bacterium]|nr:type II secretion system F family protein [bacterium]
MVNKLVGIAHPTHKIKCHEVIGASKIIPFFPGERGLGRGECFLCQLAHINSLCALSNVQGVSIMPAFIYKAADKDGIIYEGIIQRETEASVVEYIRQKGLCPIKIASKKKPVFFNLKRKEAGLIIQQLSSLISAGITIDKGLDILVRVTENKQRKEILLQIKEDIQKGNSLSTAMSAYPHLFSNLEIVMIKIGETSGTLNLALERIHELFKKQEALISRIISMLIYPFLMIGVGGLVIITVFVLVIPRFVSIFQQMGEALPVPTQILLWISQTMSGYWWLFACLLVGGIIGYKLALKTKTGAAMSDWCVLAIPWIGFLVKLLCAARFCRSMSTLLDGGIPIVDAVRIAKDSITNSIILKRIMIVQSKIKEGSGIAIPLREARVFPELMIQMVACGEEMGNLKQMLTNIADTYDITLQNQIFRIVSFLEPAMILIMGIIVALIVSAILLPIFGMSQLPI